MVIVDGFRHFSGGELRLLGALARGRDLLLAFDPDAGERVRHSYERAGDFRVNPQVAACPTWCAFRHVCRVNQFSRWKRWD